eukprot:131887_1
MASVSFLSFLWIHLILYVCQLLFSLYSIWLLWHNRQRLYMRKRRPFLIVSIVLCGLPLGAYMSVFDRHLCLHCYTVPEDINRTIVMCLVLPRQVLLTSRIWFLFYDLKYMQSLLTHQWWEDITDKKDWFFTHKGTFGSFRFMSKYICIFLTMFFIFTALGVYYFSVIYHIAFIVTINSLWVIMFVCFCKMPKMYDALKIRKEINITSFIYLLLAIYHSIVSSMRLDHRFGFVIYISSYLGLVVNMLLVICMIVLPHYYYHDHALKFQQRKQTNQSTKQVMSVVASTTHSSTGTRVRLKTDGNDKHTHVRSWQRYVNDCEDDTKFNTFVRHLTREFATENIYFILEIIQYKRQFMSDHAIQTYLGNKVYVCDANAGWIMKLPCCLPQSSIIKKYKGQFVKQIEQFYRKYVAWEATMAINMSYESRKKFMTQMNKANELNPQQTLLIFDDILSDVFRNLKGSFMRFEAIIDVYESDPKDDIISVMVSQMEMGSNRSS